MSDDKIEPALTAEEWKRSSKPLGSKWFSCGTIVGGGGITIEGSDPQEAVTVSRPDHLAALIALANADLPDDDRRKITLDTVHAIRCAADAIRQPMALLASRLYVIADALESYLP